MPTPRFRTLGVYGSSAEIECRNCRWIGWAVMEDSPVFPKDHVCEDIASESATESPACQPTLRDSDLAAVSEEIVPA